MFPSLPDVPDSRVCGRLSEIDLAACAHGNLRCLILPHLQRLWTWNAGCMLLSLSVFEKAPNATLLALRDSPCRTFLVKVTRSECTPVHEASVHTAEYWKIDSTDGSVMYSGGDGAYIYATYVRSNTTARKKSAHGTVGVISPCRGPYKIWTGSYDECMKSGTLEEQNVHCQKII